MPELDEYVAKSELLRIEKLIADAAVVRIDEPWWKKNLATLIGFVLNLLALGAMIGRIDTMITILEQRTAALEVRMTAHHEDTGMHTTAEWRQNLMNTVNRIEGKVDAHLMAQQPRSK